MELRISQAESRFLGCYLLVVLLLFVLYVIYRIRNRNRIDASSVREAIDHLPMAIGYFSESGRVRLCNMQMEKLFHILTGKDLQGYQELIDALEATDAHSKVRLLSKERGTYLFPDQSVWKFQEHRILTEDERRYREVIFADISELSGKWQQLQRQLEALKEQATETRLLADHVQELVRERENLHAKTRLHDRMGQGLIAARRVLVKGDTMDPSEASAAAELLRQAVYAMQNDSEYPAEHSQWAQLQNDAAAVGVEIVPDGSLPQSSVGRALLHIAARECLTNAVRHADATKLFIKLRETDELQIEITNDGRVPEHAIVPKGGLLNLSFHVKDDGGRMEIVSSPRFVLKISLPAGKE